MTFRGLLKRARYKDIFNIIYQEYYKGATNEQGYMADLACQRVFNHLLELAVNPNPAVVIWIHQHARGSIDICLRKRGKEECIPFVSVSIEELVDAEVRKEDLWSDVRVLAHLIYKLS